MRKRTFFKMLAAGLLAPLTKWSASKASTGPTVTITGDATEWNSYLGGQVRFHIATIDILADHVVLMVREHYFNGASRIVRYGMVGAHLNHTGLRIQRALEIAEEHYKVNLVLVEQNYRPDAVAAECRAQRVHHGVPAWPCRLTRETNPSFEVWFDKQVADGVINTPPNYWIRGTERDPIINFRPMNYKIPERYKAADEGRMSPQDRAHYLENRLHWSQTGDDLERMQAMGVELLDESRLDVIAGTIGWKPDAWAKYRRHPGAISASLRRQNHRH